MAAGLAARLCWAFVLAALVLVLAAAASADDLETDEGPIREISR